MNSPAQPLRGAADRVLSLPFVARAVRKAGFGGHFILAMHRFATGTGVHRGHSSTKVREVLKAMKAQGYRFVDLKAILDAIEAREYDYTHPLVAVTIDDGYSDLLEIGEPIFREYECPVTVFISPEIVAGSTWYWWDQLAWLVNHTETGPSRVEIGGMPITVSWQNEENRAASVQVLEQIFKSMPWDSVRDSLSELESLLGVRIPQGPPDEYRVLSWQEVRSAEDRGMRFGAHTLTHPILSNCTEERVRLEIAGSLLALRTQLRRPVDVFCYPNGGAEDYGEREFKILQSEGVRYALTMQPGFLTNAGDEKSDANWRLALPRYAFSESVSDVTKWHLMRSRRRTR